MYCYAQLESVTYVGRFDTGPDAAPEGRVEQDNINGRTEHVCRQLLKIDDYCVCCQWHPHFLTHATHACHAINRILEVIVREIFDLLTEPNRGFSGPDGIWIEAKVIAVKCFGE